MYKTLLALNEENYENCVSVDTKEELINKMVDYLKELEDLEFETLEEEVEFIAELKKQVESCIDWKGKNDYVLVGYDFTDEQIMTVEECLQHELDSIYFPVSLNTKAFTDFDGWVKEVKKEEGYKYIYLVSYLKRVTQPKEYKIDYVVYSNEKIEDVIDYLNENEGIFVGDFDSLGMNYFVEEISEFDIDELHNYELEYETKWHSVYTDDEIL